MIVAVPPYPKELRAWVVAAVEQGEFTIAEIANLFGGAPPFVKKMLRLHRAADDLKPPRGGGAAARRQKKERSWLRPQVKKRPAATRAELQKVLADKRQGAARLPTICRALQQRALPRKKGFGAAARAARERRKFRQIRAGLAIRKFIFMALP